MSFSFSLPTLQAGGSPAQPLELAPEVLSRARLAGHAVSIHTSSIPASGLAVPLRAAGCPPLQGGKEGQSSEKFPSKHGKGRWHPIHTGMPTGFSPASPHSGKLCQRRVTFPEALAPELPMPEIPFGSCLNRMKSSRHGVTYGDFRGGVTVVHSSDKVPAVLCATKSTPQLCVNASI